MQDNNHNFLHFNEKFIVQRQKKVTVDNNWIIGYSFNNISSMVRFHKSKHANVRSVSTHTL